MKQIIKLLRPHQYIKNLFVFAPLFFSFYFELYNVMNTLSAFILFSLVASSVYVLNDLLDIKEDKLHPIKCNRPLASGAVKVNTAYWLIVVLALFSFVVAFLLNERLAYILMVYFLMNVAYSFGLKHIAVVDIFIIATGFVLRLFAGAVFLDENLSMWIIIMTFLLAVFLAFAKRRDDVLLHLKGKQTRKNIDGYNLEFVNAAMTVMSAVIIVCYIQYTISLDVITRLKTDHVYLTSIFVILGVLRYMQITFVENKSGSPTQVVIRDRFLQATIFFWLLSFVVIYYYIGNA